MKIVFMGTPDFSVPTLESLIASRHEVAAVVTQPDKPRGRGKEIHMTPVKETALRHGIPVYQPVRAREASFVEEMRALEPDVMVVIAFGQILSRELLDVPRYGCVNIHASLLPKYRGGSADSVGSDQRRQGNGYYYHDDGYRDGHRRYAGEKGDCPGREGNGRKSV